MHISGIFDLASIFHLALARTQISALPDSSKATLTIRTPSIDGHVCSKCGTVKKSGKLSCCARGGAWFQKCGDAAGRNVDHTWAEGIEACKCQFSRVGVWSYVLTIKVPDCAVYAEHST